MDKEKITFEQELLGYTTRQIDHLITRSRELELKIINQASRNERSRRSRKQNAQARRDQASRSLFNS
jgi:hypothetical protein